MNLFLVVLGVHCCTQAFSGAVRGAPLGCDARALIMTASRVVELGSIGFSGCISQAQELGLRS